MKILKIDLHTHKLEELKSFYKGLLGFELVMEEKDCFSFQVGYSELSFQQVDTPQAKPFYHYAFNIPHNLLLEAKEWINDKGITLLKEGDQDIIDFPHWNARALYFYDPANNIVEFIARRDVDNTAQEPFQANKVIGISEIGLPASSIESAYEQLNGIIDLPLYSKISNLITFCAAGDPLGLFIIVPLNRPWFLTDMENGTYYTKTVVQGTNNEQIKLDNLPYYIETKTE